MDGPPVWSDFDPPFAVDQQSLLLSSGPGPYTPVPSSSLSPYDSGHLALPATPLAVLLNLAAVAMAPNPALAYPGQAPRFNYPKPFGDLVQDVHEADLACASLLASLQREMTSQAMPAQETELRVDLSNIYKQLADRVVKAAQDLDWAGQLAAPMLKKLNDEYKRFNNLVRQLEHLPVGRTRRYSPPEDPSRKDVLLNNAYRASEEVAGPDVYRSHSNKPNPYHPLNKAEILRTGTENQGSGSIVDRMFAKRGRQEIAHDAILQEEYPEKLMQKAKVMLKELLEEEATSRSAMTSIAPDVFEFMFTDEKEMLDSLHWMENRRSYEQKRDVLKTQLQEYVRTEDFVGFIHRPGGLRRRRVGRLTKPELLRLVHLGRLEIPLDLEESSRKSIGYSQGSGRNLIDWRPSYSGGITTTSEIARRSSSRRIRKSDWTPWDPSTLRQEVKFSPPPSPERERPGFLLLAAGSETQESRDIECAIEDSQDDESEIQETQYIEYQSQQSQYAGSEFQENQDGGHEVQEKQFAESDIQDISMGHEVQEGQYTESEIQESQYVEHEVQENRWVD